MDDDPLDPKKIVIDVVIGGASGERLLKCYFKEHGDTYNFHDQEGTTKAQHKKLNEPFCFHFEDPNIEWCMVITSAEGPPDTRKLNGTWSDGKDPSAADGEYQAQAGGSGEEGDPNSATACA